MDPQELGQAIARHRLYLEGRPNGRLLVVKSADLAGYDLSGLILSESMMTGVNLARAKLRSTVFDRADLLTSLKAYAGVC